MALPSRLHCTNLPWKLNGDVTDSCYIAQRSTILIWLQTLLYYREANHQIRLLHHKEAPFKFYYTHNTEIHLLFHYRLLYPFGFYCRLFCITEKHHVNFIRLLDNREAPFRLLYYREALFNSLQTLLYYREAPSKFIMDSFVLQRSHTCTCICVHMCMHTHADAEVRTWTTYVQTCRAGSTLTRLVRAT